MLEKVEDSNLDLKIQLEQESCESHEPKATNEMLQGKLQKAEADCLG